jgi:HrpA-like RNA helicase
MKYKRRSESAKQERIAAGLPPNRTQEEKIEHRRLRALVDISPEELRIDSDECLQAVQSRAAEAHSELRALCEKIAKKPHNLPVSTGSGRIASEPRSAEPVAGAVDGDLIKKEEASGETRFAEQRRSLPAWRMSRTIVDAVAQNRVVVVQGETGCGKTTQIPQFLLDAEREEGEGEPNIVCTQPRRISALSVAERVADERGERVGERSVGWQIRLENSASVDTRLLFCTTGILLRKLHGDPLLLGANSGQNYGSNSVRPGVSRIGTWNRAITHVIVDEIHERSLDSDFLLVLLRDMLLQRSDLRVILMSATLNAEKFHAFFSEAAEEGNFTVARVEIPGFTFPVRELFLEDVLEQTRYVPAVHEAGSLDRNGRGGGRRGRGPGRGRGGRGRRGDNNGWNATQETPTATSGHEQGLLRTLQNPSHRDSGYDAQTVNSITSMYRDAELGCVSFSPEFSRGPLDLDLVLDAVLYVCRDLAPVEDKRLAAESPGRSPPGAILVFLPGWGEISELMERLEQAASSERLRLRVLGLHSQVSMQNQRRVFDPPPTGTRKVVVATNIAETSITIDDVVYVIDAGKHKHKTYDASANVACLLPAWISRASARQRAGRAGRVRAGVCLHLYPKFLHDEVLEDFESPELLRTPLAEVCLQIALLELGPARSFLARAPDPPQPSAIVHALSLLRRIGALHPENATNGPERLTHLGRHLAKLPVNPQLGKMLLMGSLLGVAEPVLIIAAALGYGRSPFVLPMNDRDRSAVDAAKQRFAGRQQSDHVMLLRVFDEWERVAGHSRAASSKFARDNWLSQNSLEMIQQIKSQFTRYLRDEGFPLLPRRASDDRSDIAELPLISAVVAGGLWPNAARADAKGGRRLRTACMTGMFGRVLPHPSSVNAPIAMRDVMRHHWMVYLDKTRGLSGLMLNDCGCVPGLALLLFSDSAWADTSHGPEGDSPSSSQLEKFRRKGPNNDVVRADEWVALVKSCPDTADAVLSLRSALHHWLELCWEHLASVGDRRGIGAKLDALGDILASGVSLAMEDAMYSNGYDEVVRWRKEHRYDSDHPGPILPVGDILVHRPSTHVDEPEDQDEEDQE